jgi:predicted transcriptional regulator
MPRNRRTTRPEAEPGVFTEELAPATVAVFEPDEDFLARSRERVKAFQAGKAVAPKATVSFASAAALLDVLTPKRYALIEAVKARGKFDTIEALAADLQRDRAAVSRDLKALVAAGLLQMHEAIAPGHGRRTEITPVARKLTVELSL